MNAGVSAAVYTVDIDIHPFVSAYLSYNITANLMSYNGKKIAGLTSHKFINSKISLVNTAGSNLYTQSIIIYLP